MVGIDHKEDSFLAGIDQMDLLGLTTADRCRPIEFLRDRVKRVKFLLHPDKLVNLPAGATLPYDAVHANVIGDFLKDGIVDSRSKKPADDRILSAFWDRAASGHKKRWQPFDQDGKIRHILDLVAMPKPAAAKPAKPAGSAQHFRAKPRMSSRARSKNTQPPKARADSPWPMPPWTGERERRPYGSSFATSADSKVSDTEMPDAGEEPAPEAVPEANKDVDEPTADEPLTELDEQIKRVTAGFRVGKLFCLARDQDGRRFVLGRARLRKVKGVQRWALITAGIWHKNKLHLTLSGSDVTAEGKIVKQKLDIGVQGSALSWEHMTARGWFGFGRFSNATQEEVLKFALDQLQDQGRL